MSLLRDLKHANVVTLHDIVHTEKTLVLVFEYCDSDLKAYMDDNGNLLHLNNVRVRSCVLMSAPMSKTEYYRTPTTFLLFPIDLTQVHEIVFFFKVL